MILLIISIFLTVMMIMMVVMMMMMMMVEKRLPVENLALSLLLAKFFALLAIFLCQLLFPNKQHLHRF